MCSLWVRPWALSADHDFNPADHVVSSIAGLVLLIGIFAIGFKFRHRHPWVVFALMWPLIALLPTNSLIPKIDLVTEKPLYLAWIGPSLAIGAAIPMQRRSVMIATAVLICALGAASFWRASFWRDPVRLWQDAALKAPNKSRCWNNLGMAYLMADRDQEAVAVLERAIQLDPENEFARSNLTTARILCGSPCAEN
jgi:tetratricopeptide (TPR) repeat protein